MFKWVALISQVRISSTRALGTQVITAIKGKKCFIIFDIKV